MRKLYNNYYWTDLFGSADYKVVYMLEAKSNAVFRIKLFDVITRKKIDNEIYIIADDSYTWWNTYINIIRKREYNVRVDIRTCYYE